MKTIENEIIIEFGTLFSKVGFAGECVPREKVRNPKWLKAFLSIERNKMKKRRKIKYVKHDLLELFEKIFYDVLLIKNNEIDSEKKFFHKYDIKILTNIFINKIFLELVEYILVNHFHFQKKKIQFLNSQICALVGSANNTFSGLVIDCGYEESRIVPFFEGSFVQNAVKIVPCGGKSVNEKLRKNLIKEKKENEFIFGKPKREIELEKFEKNQKDKDKEEKEKEETKTKKLKMEEDLEDFREKILEDIVVRVCFCDNKIANHDETSSKTLNSKSLTFLDPKSVIYEKFINFPSELFLKPRKHKIEISVENRTKVFDDIFAGDLEGFSITRAVIEAILTCSVDSRIPIVSNIILTGGLSDIVGFSFKLFTQICHEFEKNKEFSEFGYLFQKFRLFKPTFPSSLLNWFGASVYTTQRKNEIHPIIINNVGAIELMKIKKEENEKAKVREQKMGEKIREDTKRYCYRQDEIAKKKKAMKLKEENNNLGSKSWLALE